LGGGEGRSEKKGRKDKNKQTNPKELIINEHSKIIIQLKKWIKTEILRIMMMVENSSKMKNHLKNKMIHRVINTMNKTMVIINNQGIIIMMEMMIMGISTIITETTTIMKMIMKTMTMISQSMLMSKTRDSMKL